MRRCWSTSLAFGLSFIKSYLRHSENLTIEEIQRRSRSIPFMTAPFGIKVHKAKVPVFPYRLKAETMVNECLTDEEKDLVYPHLKPYNNNNNDHDHDQSIETCENCGHRISDNVPLVMADPHREGLDVEWLESIGDDVEIESDIPEDNYGVVIYFHGGGYYTGSKEEHRVLLGPLVKRLGKKIRVLNVGYRLAPQDPFPAALVDGISAYIWVLDQSISEVFGLDNYNSPEIGKNDRFQPNQVIVMGDSAGSGLALSLCLILRDHNTIPQPLSVVAWSPWVDLTQSLPSFDAHGITDCIPFGNFIHRYSLAVDMMFEDQQETGGKNGDDNEERPVRQRAQVYCPDSCLRIKYVSPLFETDFRGITNVFITCGSAERFFDESVLLAVLLEEQQQPCRIDIHEEMPHIFQLFRYHPSSSAAINRSSDYIREMINKNSSGIIVPHQDQAHQSFKDMKMKRKKLEC
ncbi:hypothetical protein BGZ49_002084 [Haplosporangium sp. Z 27]|nr:hypothetical protein BGZ49_002084 [Haplosporangium sp. Z 27]